MPSSSFSQFSAFITLLALSWVPFGAAVDPITRTAEAYCQDADEVFCKRDCGIAVIRCTGPGTGVEFNIQGSGLVKCYMRYLDGAPEPQFILSTSCSMSSIPPPPPPGQVILPRNCVVPANVTTPEVEEEMRGALRVVENERGFLSFAVAKAVSTTFNVYFHVVYPSEGNAAKLSADRVKKQIEVINADFKTYRFNLAKVYYYLNKTWFDKANQDVAGTPIQNEMKKKTRIGGSRDLNVWTVGFTSMPSALGYSTFPQYYKTFPKNDGIVIHHGSVPKGVIMNYNLGRTLTHEIGHWMGLLHTFQGGCGGSGDGVEDTPGEASGASGCPVGRDSCKGAKGLDPIKNFMDYSYDSCMTEFTQGQYFRMAAAITLYRS
ncbi:hypothetical protein HDU97_001884 [Phlyctochytrium planicorne]|nr:hypothetical protein HDU97_001884 [Phlyctochytrium planicorne]